MKGFFKLVNFEVNRFAKVYAVLLILIVLLQAGAVFFESNRLVKSAKDSMRLNKMNIKEFFLQGGLDLSYVQSSLFYMAPVVLSICVLLLYSFFIWYRDWSPNNAFIYRLLSIPVPRISIYFSKLTALLIMVLGLVAFQSLLLPLENLLFRSVVPSEFLNNTAYSDALKKNTLLSMLYPSTFTQFVLYYGAGAVFLITLFTSILLERSFKWKGIFLAVCYGTAVYLTMYLLVTAVFSQLYPSEMLYCIIAYFIFAAAVSIWLSNYLITKKITV